MPIVERLSYLLAFLITVLIIWTALQLMRAWPDLRAVIQRRFFLSQKQKETAVIHRLLHYTYRRAQSTHLAAQLFPLSDLLIQPKLLAPPGFILDPHNSMKPTLAANEVIPHLPDWPEFNSPFPSDEISPSGAMQHGLDIAIIGRPGAGKSTALAALAAQVAHQDMHAGDLSNHIPVYLHVADLVINPEGIQSALQAVAVPLAHYLNIHYEDLIPILSNLLRDRRWLFLLDGLDEIAPENITPYIDFLDTLIEDYPFVRIALTASSAFIGDLARLQIYPFPIAPWKPEQRLAFIQNWENLWNEQIQPGVKKHLGFKPFDSHLINGWLSNSSPFLTPFELTLRVWCAYAGDGWPDTTVHAIDAYLRRLNVTRAELSSLQRLAYRMLCARSPIIPRNDALELLTQNEHTPLQQSAVIRSKSFLEIDNYSQSLIDSLITAGILIGHPQSLVRFSHPFLAGFLAGTAIKAASQVPEISPPLWDIEDIYIQHVAVTDLADQAIFQALQVDDAPLFDRLFLISRWLPVAPLKNNWHEVLLRKLANLLLNESQPMGIRYRALAGLLFSADPDIPQLLVELTLHPSPTVRQLAVLGLGVRNPPGAAGELTKLLLDPDAGVRLASSLAAGALRDQSGRALVAGLIHNQDNALQRAAAQSVAEYPLWYSLLRQNLDDPDHEIRMAMILGLDRVDAEWVDPLLEHMAANDPHWMVKNAAAETLQNRSHPRLPGLKPLTAPIHSTWLAGKAEIYRKNPNDAVELMEILVWILREGAPEDKIAAMQYLRTRASDLALIKIYELVYSDRGIVSETGLYYLWFLSISGCQLPSPNLYLFKD
jgi:hypothetical protein